MKVKNPIGAGRLGWPLVLASVLAGWPGPANAAEEGNAAERRRILERLRCEGVESDDCFIPDDAQDADDPPPLYYDAEGRPVSASQVDIDYLVEQIRSELERHEEKRVVEAGEELQDQRFAEMRFFGVTDHYLDPPIDFYKDPIKSITRQPLLFLDQIRPEDFDIPLVVNERVQDWMVYFLTSGRKHYTRWLGRAKRYQPMINARLDEKGMPRALFYQAMIESGFSPYAYSYAKAAGMWQFIAETGRRYGMQIDWWVDERRDPQRATLAAMDYMTFLHKRFGDWYLASAAYNAGEGKIDRAIQRYGTRDFWEMSKGDYLRQETKDYVPKMIAAAILGTYAERYGLVADVKEWLEPLEYDTVEVPEATDVGVIAKCSGTTEEAILEMNPALRRWCTPPEVPNYTVRIPKGAAETFAQKFEQIPPEERLTFKRYKIKKGDSVPKIARIYGVSADAIRRMNGVKGDKLQSGQYLVIPVRALKEGEQRTVVHDVRSGESLGVIARRYGVGVEQIKDWNDLKRDTILVGQRLVLQLGADAPDSADADGEARTAVASAEKDGGTEGDKDGGKATAVASKSGAGSEARPAADAGAAKKTASKGDEVKSAGPVKVAHVVVKGDTLGEIAGKYGVGIADIRSWNKIKGNRIVSGQKLVVWLDEDAARKLTHTIAAGDTLWEIANRYGVSISDLRQWNDIGAGDTLHQGDRLVVISTKADTAMAKAASSEKPAKLKTVIHKVAAGDTLWSIAQRYRVSVDDLKGWNSLSRTTLYVGEKLKLKIHK